MVNITYELGVFGLSEDYVGNSRFTTLLLRLLLCDNAGLAMEGLPIGGVMDVGLAALEVAPVGLGELSTRGLDVGGLWNIGLPTAELPTLPRKELRPDKDPTLDPDRLDLALEVLDGIFRPASNIRECIRGAIAGPSFAKAFSLCNVSLAASLSSTRCTSLSILSKSSL